MSRKGLTDNIVQAMSRNSASGLEPRITKAMADKIQALREEGGSLVAIAKLFNETGYPTPTGSGQWHDRTIQKIEWMRQEGRV